MKITKKDKEGRVIGMQFVISEEAMWKIAQKIILERMEELNGARTPAHRESVMRTALISGIEEAMKMVNGISPMESWDGGKGRNEDVDPEHNHPSSDSYYLKREEE